MCHSRKLRGHSWLLLDSKLLETAINVFYLLKWKTFINFSFLNVQEVLRLLHVSILSFKEAKRTFLTPVGVKTFRNSRKCLLFTKMKHITKSQLSRCSGSALSPPCFQCVIQEAKRTFLTPWWIFFYHESTSCSPIWLYKTNRHPSYPGSTLDRNQSVLLS
jgi:hypothetical protein